MSIGITPLSAQRPFQLDCVGVLFRLRRVYGSLREEFERQIVQEDEVITFVLIQKAGIEGKSGPPCLAELLTVLVASRYAFGDIHFAMDRAPDDLATEPNFHEQYRLEQPWQPDSHKQACGHDELLKSGHFLSHTKYPPRRAARA